MVKKINNKFSSYSYVIHLDKKWLAELVAEILMKSFGDNRIVHPKSKDSIIQGIILYLTHPKSVEVLEGVSETL